MLDIYSITLRACSVKATIHQKYIHIIVKKHNARSAKKRAVAADSPLSAFSLLLKPLHKAAPDLCRADIAADHLFAIYQHIGKHGAIVPFVIGDLEGCDTGDG